MAFDFSMFTRYGGVLLEGLVNTVFICFIGLVLGLLIGAVTCWIKMKFPSWCSAIANMYIEFFRGTPFLIQVFLLYYVGPVFGLDLSAMAAGIIGLSLYGGAYFAEIYRSGILSIPKGQIEAAQALGISEAAILFRIVIPQMLGLILAPLANQIITLVKESAILSVITVQELTFVGQRAISETYNYVEVYAMVALLYWAIVSSLSFLFGRLEVSATRHLRKKESPSQRFRYFKKQEVLREEG
jgi:polar amino acid transport system permease protein